MALLGVLLVSGGIYLGLMQRQPTSRLQHEQPVQPSPTTARNSGLFPNPNEPGYIPGKGFTPDAQRIGDLVALQVSVEKYRAANGRYPDSLNDVLPRFAPLNEDGAALPNLPRDPKTHQPYEYRVASDGMNYRISVTLSSGKRLVRTAPKNR
jgi:hypothetical protein